MADSSNALLLLRMLPLCAPLETCRASEPYRPQPAFGQAIDGRTSDTCSLACGNALQRFALHEQQFICGIAVDFPAGALCFCSHLPELLGVLLKLALNLFLGATELLRYLGVFFHMPKRMRASSHRQAFIFNYFREAQIA